MADQRFFKRNAVMTLAQLAELTYARVAPGSDPDFIVRDVAPLDVATKENLSFLDNKKYTNQFKATRAGAVIISEELAELAPKGTQLLLSKAPYKSYALAAQAFYPEERPESGISKYAMIDQAANIAAGAVIEPGVIIKAGATIGKDAWLQAGCVIGENVQIGGHVRIGEKAVVSHAIIGDHVRLYPGACVGQDGFGFAIDPAGHVKVPQLGRVIIEDHVQIGANSCIDRGAGPDTVIGAGTWIDNLVQIGHNVKIGRGCIIVAQAGIAGSTELGDFVAVGGQAGIAGHLKIAAGTRLAAQSGVMRDITQGGQEHMGTPAMPIRVFMKQVATLNRLIKQGKSS